MDHPRRVAAGAAAHLRWLDMMLGSTPVFDAPTRLYQRLLAGDVAEAIELLTTTPADRAAPQGSSGSPTAWRCCWPNCARSALPARRSSPAACCASDCGRTSTRWPPRCSPIRSPRSACRRGRWRRWPVASPLPRRSSRVRAAVALSTFNPEPQASLRCLARRLARRLPAATIVAGTWNIPAGAQTPDDPSRWGVDAVTAALPEAVVLLGTASGAVHGAEAAADSPLATAPRRTASVAPRGASLGRGGPEERAAADCGPQLAAIGNGADDQPVRWPRGAAIIDRGPESL